VHSDAARKLDEPASHHGYGIWIWPEGSSVVFYAAGRWTQEEMRLLDITALEYHTQTMGARLVRIVHAALGLNGGRSATGQAIGRDVLFVGDNESASTHAGQSQRARAQTLRTLVGVRARALDEYPLDRVLSLHVWREQGQEADDLSKADFEAFAERIDARFGVSMGTSRMPEPLPEWRSMRPALEIAKRLEQEAKERGGNGRAEERPHTRVVVRASLGAERARASGARSEAGGHGRVAKRARR